MHTLFKYLIIRSLKIYRAYNLIKSRLVEIINGIALRYVVRYIIWDFDGTLYQSEKLGTYIEKQYRILFRALTGKTVSKEQFSRLSSHFGSWSKTISNVASISEDRAMSIVDKTYDNSKFIRPDPVMVSRIHRLKKYKHIILSNATHAQIVSGLQAIGFNKNNRSVPPFMAIVGRDDTRVMKPSFESFRYVLRLTHGYKLQHVLVGDSVEADIRPARMFGFWGLHRDAALKILDS